MDEKIDLGLFARLMQFHASARKDLLEYMGQGPVAVPPVVPQADRPKAAPDRHDCPETS
ncbi:hypothetical protein HKCCSP123_08915 [Rhodobacterales bacterium HKCCSP123]|nr:hypothetical protein [Rhodobacterales bacterium HKCCSP123]